MSPQDEVSSCGDMPNTDKTTCRWENTGFIPFIYRRNIMSTHRFMSEGWIGEIKIGRASCRERV